MMNLHALAPDDFPDEDINIDLPAIYKDHVPHTHERALQEIFMRGCLYAWDESISAVIEAEEKMTSIMAEAETRYAALQDQINQAHHRNQQIQDEKNALQLKVSNLQAQLAVRAP